MNINQVFNILLRVFGRRLLNWGIRRMNAPMPGARRGPQQRGREKATREAVKRVRQAARIVRRIR